MAENLLPSGPVFHERQWLRLCAIHCVNNLMQSHVYDKQDFEAFASQLQAESRAELDKFKRDVGLWTYWTTGWVNPHKSLLGFGNYDANVLSLALQKLGLELKWFDARKAVTEIPLLDGAAPAALPDSAQKPLVGIIVNCRLQKLSVFGGRHWFAIRWIGQHYVNLDSELESPERFSSAESVYEYLDFLTQTREAQVFLVSRAEPK